MTAALAERARPLVPIEVALEMGDVRGLVDEVLPPIPYTYDGRGRQCNAGQVWQRAQRRDTLLDYLTTCTMTYPAPQAAARVGVNERTIWRLRKALRDAGYQLPQITPRS